MTIGNPRRARNNKLSSSERANTGGLAIKLTIIRYMRILCSAEGIFMPGVPKNLAVSIKLPTLRIIYIKACGNIMKKRLSILAVFCMGLVLPAVMNAQTLRNGSNAKVGTIESNGTVRNASNAKIGTIESNGTVRNASNAKVGTIESNGTVRNGSNAKIGTVESDGTVRNGSNTKIGTAQGVKRQWAAAFFFFDFFNR